MKPCLHHAILSLSCLTLFGCNQSDHIAPSESTASPWGVNVAPGASQEEGVPLERPIAQVDDEPRVVEEPAHVLIEEEGEDAPGFIVHEWGTFTSMQSSSGETLHGMYEEEESLPPFVHRLAGPDPYAVKGVPQDLIVPRHESSMQALLYTTTQRLETPVLYFYGDKAPEQVSISVDFPEGLISEWYPKASTYNPTTSTIREIANGSMTWNVDLLSRQARTVEVAEGSIWAPSRRVDALTVKVEEEEEPLIFYRGVGAFTLPVEVESVEGGALTVTNTGEIDIPQAFLYKNVNGRRAIYPIGGLSRGVPVVHGEPLASPSPKEAPVHHSMSELKAPLVAALIEQGLYEKEAHAMVDTWERSYFETPGVRVLYVVPRAWTDELLPITIEPAPDELVRVLIGRIEVQFASQEAKFEAVLRAHFEAGTSPDFRTLVHFIMPRLNHLRSQRERLDTKFVVWLDDLTSAYHRIMPVLKEESFYVSGEDIMP